MSNKAESLVYRKGKFRQTSHNPVSRNEAKVEGHGRNVRIRYKTNHKIGKIIIKR